MAGLPSFQASLFYSAAFAHLITIPKHLYVGATKIPKTIESIPDTPDTAVGKAVIGSLWDHGNCFLIVATLLNIKWARYGPPRLLEEKLIVAATWLAGLYVGVPYYKKSMYLPLGMLWIAPVTTIVASIL